MSKVKTFVEASGKITTVMELGVGNVYKRLQVETYGEDKMMFGIVTDLNNNGEQSYIVASEFNPVEYGGSELKSHVFGGERDVNIFPVSVEDWNAAFASNRASMERAVNEKFSAAEKAKAALDALVAAAASVTEGVALTEATLVSE